MRSLFLFYGEHELNIFYLVGINNLDPLHVGSHLFYGCHVFYSDVYKMNIRLQKYKQNRLLGMSQYNAARAAGYSESYAKTRNTFIERSSRIDMANAFEQAGITDKFLAKMAFEALQATFGNDKPNWMIRHKFFESVSKMTGRQVDKVEHSGIPSTQVNVYPNKTIIFQDINDSDKADTSSLHEPEGSEGIRPEVKI